MSTRGRFRSAVIAGTALGRRLAEAMLGVPIFLKVMGIATALTLLLSAGMLWQIHQTWHGRLRIEADERARMLGVQLAAHGEASLLARDAGAVRKLLDEAKARYPGVAYIVALDENRRVIAATPDGAPSAEILAAGGLDRDGGPRRVVLETEFGEVREVAVPVSGGRAGTIRVGMSEEPIRRRVAWMVRRLAEVTAVIAAFGIVAAWGLARLLTQPVLQLVELSRAVSRGDYGTRARVSARDEVGELATAFNEMTASLEEKERSRQALLRQVIVAGEEERRRIARELHDHTGQSLVSLIAGLGALRTGVPAGDAGDRVARLEKLAAEILSDVHDLSRALRPSVLDDIGLMPALSRLAETVERQTGTAVACEGLGPDDAARLPGEIEIAVYRIVQEALANAVRHGRARAVHVLLQRRQDALLVIVEDDGQGFDAQDWRARCARGEHLGLLGIEERAALLGGTLRVESGPGAGTGLFVEIPLRGKEGHEPDPSADRR